MLTLGTFAKKYAKPLWLWYVIGSIFLAGTNLITLKIPQFAKDIVNGLNLENSNIARLESLAIGIVLLGLAQILCRSLSRILIFWPGRQLEATAKKDLFARAISLPQSVLEKFGLGDLISRLSNDLGQVRVFFAFAALQILNLIFLLSFTVVQMLSVHVLLTVLCLFPIALMLVTSRYLMPILAKYSRLNQEAVGHLTNIVTEAFSHVHVIQSNNAEAGFLQKTGVENDDVYNTNMKLVTFRTFFFPLLTSLTSVAQVCVLGYGGYLTFSGAISIGDLLAFNIYIGYLAFPMTSLGIVMSIYQRSKTAVSRISPITEEEPEKTHPRGELKTIKKDILIEIQDLSFTHRDSPQPALKGIHLQIAAGEKIGLCGPVGSGKSTLFNLITRIYDPPANTLFLKGEDVRTVSPEKLRQTIGYALQRAQLFSSEITENLSFGLEKELTINQLKHATDQAQVSSDIEALPLSWQTQIGEKGVRLSGGQKQRLALARLFLRDYELLLLDDVLSAVDNNTEAAIVASLSATNTAAFISSHRSSVLKACDRVLFMKDGTIVDEGSYADLAQKYPEIQEKEPNDSPIE